MATNTFVLDQNIWRLWFAGQVGNELKTVKDWCVLENADICFNLGVFDMRKGATYGASFTFVKGPKINVDPSGETHPTIGGKSNVLVLNSQNKCKGYSNGIVNNVIKINAPMGGSRTRNGIGITDKGHAILAQCGHKSTERAFCNDVLNAVKAKGQNVKLFILQDGGGSTTSYSARANLDFNPEPDKKGILRPVATVVCAKMISYPVMYRPIRKGCKGADVGILQTLMCGIQEDESAGDITKKRIKAMQAALGFDVELQVGVASAWTYKKMGLPYNF